MLTPNAAGEWDVVNNDGNRPRGEDPKEKRRIQNRIAQRVYREPNPCDTPAVEMGPSLQLTRRVR